MPIEKLVSDVAVDPVHVRELADSIKVSGPISPVLVREETSELIDGFHRVAAMKELGFPSVESILTPCDQETFWDMRIMSATLHKAVTFARAVDWIDEAFKASRWKDQYTSARGVFEGFRRGYVTGEAKNWVETKAQKWGLAVATIEGWLQAKEAMAPELREELKTPVAPPVPSDTYIEIARTLQTKPQLQKRVLDKAREEGLGSRSVREISRAVREAADEEEVKTILAQPISRTAEDLTRAAKVEKILSHPREISVEEKRLEAKVEDVLFKLDLLSMIASAKGMTQEKIDVLTPAQGTDVYETCEEAIKQIRRVMDMIRLSVEVEYKLIEPTE